MAYGTILTFGPRLHMFMHDTSSSSMPPVPSRHSYRARLGLKSPLQRPRPALNAVARKSVCFLWPSYCIFSCPLLHEWPWQTMSFRLDSAAVTVRAPRWRQRILAAVPQGCATGNAPVQQEQTRSATIMGTMIFMARTRCKS